MSGPEEIAEIAADGVADGMHIVGEGALEAEEVIRGFNKTNIAWLGLGLVIGGAIGGFAAYRLAYRKAEARANEIADEEIESMRNHYHSKEVARDNEVGKVDLETIVRERGYREDREQPPMGMKPPSSVVDRAQEIAESEDAIAGEPPDDEDETLEEHRARVTQERNIFRDNPPSDDVWDWHEERKNRSPRRPYIIHRDEKDEHEAYETVIYTYYEDDDVVCNEIDEVIDMEDRERIFGEAVLEKFGHGSGDPTTVLVRNDLLSMDMEICRSPNSYLEEVKGIEPPPIRHSHHRERRNIDDE